MNGYSKHSNAGWYKAVILLTAVAVMALWAMLSQESTLLAQEEQQSGKRELTDIAGHWAEAQIVDAAARGYVNGYPDGTFRPDDSLTRAEFVTMLSRAVGLELEASAEGSMWYHPYVNAAVVAGYHREGELAGGSWNDPITRFEMSRLAIRATIEELRDSKYMLQDNAVMYHATKQGIIRGLPGGDLAKNGLTTRAQSVTVIERILAILSGETLEVDELAFARAEREMKFNPYEVTEEEKQEIFERLAGYKFRWDPDKDRYGNTDFKTAAEYLYESAKSRQRDFVYPLKYEVATKYIEVDYNKDYRSLDESYKVALLAFQRQMRSYKGERYHPRDYVDLKFQETIDNEINMEATLITDMLWAYKDFMAYDVLRGELRFIYHSHKDLPDGLELGVWYKRDVEVVLDTALSNFIDWDLEEYSVISIESLGPAQPTLE